MSAQTWSIIAIVGFSLSAVLLVACIFIFLKLNILAVIGDLTGKTVAREIEAMRENNASSGAKLHKSSRVNMDRGKLTQKVSSFLGNGRIISLVHASKKLDAASGSVSSEELDGSDEFISVEMETDSLKDANTAVAVTERSHTAELTDHTSVIGSGRKMATTVLHETSNNIDTTVLTQNLYIDEEETIPVDFKIIRSIVEIHTDEVIE